VRGGQKKNVLREAGKRGKGYWTERSEKIECLQFAKTHVSVRVTEKKEGCLSTTFCSAESKAFSFNPPHSSARKESTDLVAGGEKKNDANRTIGGGKEHVERTDSSRRQRKR